MSVKAKLDTQNLRPFLAPVLFEKGGTLVGAPLLGALVREASRIIRQAGGAGRTILAPAATDTVGDLRLHALMYREKRAPAWLRVGAVHDTTHELLVIAVRDGQAAICASDGTMRDRLVKELKTVRRVPRSTIETFVGDETTAIWLNGVHTPTAVKANTKILTGSSLEHALDPLGDQTYYFSALRSRPTVVGLKDAQNQSLRIGVAPQGGRVWVGRPASWSDFVAQLAAILDHAKSAKTPPTRLAFLAQPTNDVSAVTDAYALAIIPEELLSEDAVAERARERVRRWAYDAQFEVTSSAGLSLVTKVFLAGRDLGELEIDVVVSNGEASFTSNWKTATRGLEGEREELTTLLEGGSAIKIYYESGHAISQKRVYLSGFSDQPFPWQFADLNGYDVELEKPRLAAGQQLASQIGAAGDSSLFAYVQRAMFVDASGNPSGWLACDDGSMELADFIHIDPSQNKVTLVHVKASDTDSVSRQASVSSFEIVVAQAIKNLRHLDRLNLWTELDRGSGKKIGAAVWKDGVKQSNRKQFLAVAKGLPATTTKVALVLQPRLTRRERDACQQGGVAQSRAMRMKQLNGLLLSAKLSAMACGADLIAIGHDL